MAKIVHIETATNTCSAALSSGEELISFRESHIDKSHAGLLTVFIGELFKEAGISPKDIDAISVSMGPGSYTGLRIGVSVAKGMAYSLNIPLIAVDTLKAMTQGYLKRDFVDNNKSFLLCPMIDARRMEVYLSLFDQKMQRMKETEAVVIDKNSFSEELEENKIFFFGSGAPKCKAIISHNNAVFIEDFQNSARDMISLAYRQFKIEDFVDVAYFEPYYLKDFIATTPKNKILGSY